MVEPAPEGSPASFGAFVTTLDESGQRATVRLVGPDEADPRTGLLSVASPMGRALLGKQRRDEKKFDEPIGCYRRTI